MPLKFKTLVYLLLFLATFYAHGQDSKNRENYALLWEIEHPDSDKKSYIFGTAHLTDERVFKFCDQVIPAIKSTDVFALEVHPDSMLNSISDYKTIGNDKDYLKIYKKVLSKKEYKKLDEIVLTETGKSLHLHDDVSIRSLETLLRPKPVKETDKATFLDVYLYGIAKSIKKEIKGLEKIEDQLDIIDDLSTLDIREQLLYFINEDKESYYKKYESLIDIYYTGDLKKVENFENGYIHDDEFIARNKVMAGSIKKVMNTNSIFAAIGAAHLPGKNGVIELLRNEGFTVNRVIPTFNNVDHTYSYDLGFDHWQLYNDEKSGYQLSVPTASQQLDILGIYKGYQSIDLVTGISFIHIGLPISRINKKSKEEITESLIGAYKTGFDEDNEAVSDSVIRNGKTFHRIKGTKDYETKHIEFYTGDNYVYVFGALVRDNPESQVLLEHFFNSIKIEEPEIDDTNTWSILTSEEGAYEVEFPTVYNDLSRESKNPIDPSGEPYKLNLYMGEDVENDYNYLFRYNNFPMGYYLQDYSNFINEYKETIEKRNGQFISEKSYDKDGNRILEFEVLLSQKYHSWIRVICRGNRSYLLLAQRTSPIDRASLDNPFFNSFTLKPFKEPELEELKSLNDDYKFMFPVTRKVEKDTTIYNPTEFSHSYDYIGLDENSGNLYYFNEISLGDYFHDDDLSTYMDTYVEYIKEENDSIYKRTKTSINGVESLEIFVQNPNSNVAKRVKAFFFNDKIISMTNYHHAKEIESAYTNRFFDSFKPLQTKNIDFTKSKASLIIEDLMSNDSLLYEKAMTGLNYYKFKKSDNPVLLKALDHKYDDNNEYYGALNMLILNIGLTGENSSLEKLEDIYKNPRTLNANKTMIIESLPKFKTTEAADLYFKLLNHSIPRETDDYYITILESESDSLFSIEKYGEMVLGLQNKEEMRPHTIPYFSRKIFQDSTSITFLNKNKETFRELFIKDASQLLEDDEKVNTFPESSYFNIIDTLTIKDTKTLEIVKQLAFNRKKVDHINLLAFEHYIKFQEKPDKKRIQQFLEPLYYRHEGMAALHHNDLDKLIPKSYLTNKEYAHLSLYNSLFDSDNNYQIKYKGKLKNNKIEYLVYEYYIDDEEPQLAVITIDKERLKDLKAYLVNYDYSHIYTDNWKETALGIIKKKDKEVKSF